MLKIIKLSVVAFVFYMCLPSGLMAQKVNVEKEYKQLFSANSELSIGKVLKRWSAEFNSEDKRKMIAYLATKITDEKKTFLSDGNEKFDSQSIGNHIRLRMKKYRNTSNPDYAIVSKYVLLDFNFSYSTGRAIAAIYEVIK